MDKRFITNSLMVMAVVLLTGCSMYDNKPAPSYDNLSAKKTNEPDSLGSQTQAQSVERPTESNTLNNSNNPYSGYSATNPNAAATTNGATGAAANNPNGANNANADLPPGAAEQATSVSRDQYYNNTVDPRIKEGQDIISNTDNSNLTTNSAGDVVLRPTNSDNNSANNAVKSTQNTAQQATQQTSQNANVTKSTATAENTVKSQPAQTAANTTTAAAIATNSNLSATDTLLQEAKTAVVAGDYEKAATALERAHRIEPNDAKILYDIAQIRQVQGKHKQAESFAGKAANLSTDKALSKKIWTLLSEIRLSLGNQTGADLAAKKAATF